MGDMMELPVHPEHLEKMVVLDLPEDLEHKVPLGPLALLVQLVHQVHQVKMAIPDYLDLLDLSDLSDQLVQLVILVKRDQMELLALLVTQAPLDLLEESSLILLLHPHPLIIPLPFIIPHLHQLSTTNTKADILDKRKRYYTQFVISSY